MAIAIRSEPASLKLSTLHVYYKYSSLVFFQKHYFMFLRLRLPSWRLGYVCIKMWGVTAISRLLPYYLPQRRVMLNSPGFARGQTPIKIPSVMPLLRASGSPSASLLLSFPLSKVWYQDEWCPPGFPFLYRLVYLFVLAWWPEHWKWVRTSCEMWWFC